MIALLRCHTCEPMGLYMCMIIAVLVTVCPHASSHITDVPVTVIRAVC